MASDWTLVSTPAKRTRPQSADFSARKRARYWLGDKADALEREWAAADHPDDSADEFWYRAQNQRWRERAYALWEREGCPEGKADEHWCRIIDFEWSA